MANVKEKKAQVINELQDTFSRCSIGVITDYRGMPGGQMTILRRKLREAGIEYRVVKNTMARFAAERLNRKELAEAFKGPVAIAFGYKEATAPAKLLNDYIETTKASLAIRGGFLGDRFLSAQDIKSLAKLPPREVLLSRVLGGMQSPISSLVYSLSFPLRQTIGILQARIQQLETK